MSLNYPKDVVLTLFFASAAVAQAAVEWLFFEGGEGPGKGKHVALVSGDEEYRSEEVLSTGLRQLIVNACYWPWGSRARFRRPQT